MKLTRRRTDRPLISLVPMIDVMLILLVFFMVTSTYLNLDMISMVDQGNDGAAAAPAAGTEATTVMITIGADGQARIRGQTLNRAALETHMSARVADNPLISVLLFPSTQATTQNLVTAMDAITSAGATRIRLLRLEEDQ